MPKQIIINGTPIKSRKLELPYNPKLKDRAKELRQAGNLSEVIFWTEVKKNQFHGIDFDRQRVIGHYIVDFYCKQLGLVIEIDGESHNYKIEYDETREAFLKALKLEIIHFNDIDIKNDMDSVLQYLEDFIIKRFRE